MIRTPIFALLMGFFLHGCGFTPIYATNTSYGDLLASIAIETPDSRPGQMLRIHLEDTLNPEGITYSYRYKLVAQIGYSVKALAIDPDGTAARYAIEAVSDYAFHPFDDASNIHRGTVRRSVSYNVSEDQDYATFIAEQDAVKRAIKEIAEAYRAELIAQMSFSGGAK